MPSLSSSGSHASPRASPSAFSCPGFATSWQLSGPRSKARSGTPSPSVSTAMIGVGVGVGAGGGGGGSAGGGGVGPGCGPGVEPLPGVEPPPGVEPLPGVVALPAVAPVASVPAVKLASSVGPVPAIELSSADSDGPGVGLARVDPESRLLGVVVSVGSRPASTSSRGDGVPPTSGSGEFRTPEPNSATSSTTPTATANAAIRAIRSRRRKSGGLAASGGMRWVGSADGTTARATGGLRSSMPVRVASARSSAASAARAWRRIRSASGRVRVAVAPVSRLSARVPNCSATATLMVRQASSTPNAGASAVESASAVASFLPSRSRRSARRAVRRLTPRGRRLPAGGAHVRHRLLEASQHARQTYTLQSRQ